MTSNRTWYIAFLLFLLVTGGAAHWLGKHHSRLAACISCLFPRSTTGYIRPLGRTYRTEFRSNENPLSDGMNWVNGSNVVSVDGRAFGTQPGAVPPPYTDSTALLSGQWGSDQFVQIVVWWDGSAGTDRDYDEVEIRLRGTLARNWNRTYNINCRVGTPSAGSYIQMGRANGPPDDFTPPFAELRGPNAACQNGDVLTGTIVGNVITAYINGRRVIQATDSVITSGAPGFGFFHQGTNGQNTDFGISRFAASDLFPCFVDQAQVRSKLLPHPNIN